MVEEAAKKVREAEAALEEAKQQLCEARGRQLILCSCGKYHPFRNLVLIQTHWYVEPHGCTGGDYWNAGEWNYRCPVTNHRNRLLFNDYDIPWNERDSVLGAEDVFKSKYRSAFASVVNEHKTDRDDFTNNYYVDQNRKKFGLPAKRIK